VSELLKQLREKKIGEAFLRMGLDFEALFSPAQAMQQDPYRNHHWVVKENDEYLVVNAIPEKEDQDHLFWEEWYLHADEVHHHILSLWESTDYHEVFQAPEQDDIHPAQCFGSRWFVIDDADMRPLRLRR